MNDNNMNDIIGPVIDERVYWNIYTVLLTRCFLQSVLQTYYVHAIFWQREEKKKRHFESYWINL